MRYLVVLLLIGCAKEGGWDKPGATDQDFHADRGQCIAQSYQAITAYQQQAIMAGCMQGKGWYWRER
jgi:hypothetical protein